MTRHVLILLVVSLVLVLSGIWLVLNLPARQVDLATANQLAQSGQVTALDLSGTTLTVTTNTERVRVEGVSQEMFDSILITAAKNTNLSVQVSLAPDSLRLWRIYGSYLAVGIGLM